jgi:hypothetical protein
MKVAAGPTAEKLRERVASSFMTYGLSREVLFNLYRK